MKLIKYLQSNNIRQKEFASMAGISESYVCLILKGRRLPSVSVALQIEKATNGEVQAIEILGLINNNGQ